MSTFAGTVIDGVGKQPLAGVAVTATSPVLEGAETQATDEQGDYQISGLPPGYYTLSFELDGFKPFERDDIELHDGRTIHMNVELLPDNVGAAADAS